MIVIVVALGVFAGLTAGLSALVDRLLDSGRHTSRPPLCEFIIDVPDECDQAEERVLTARLLDGSLSQQAYQAAVGALARASESAR